MFEYIATGKDSVQCQVSFYPNRNFDDYRYFERYGSVGDLKLSLEEMEMEVALCVDQYLQDRGMLVPDKGKSMKRGLPPRSGGGPQQQGGAAARGGAASSKTSGPTLLGVDAKRPPKGTRLCGIVVRTKIIHELVAELVHRVWSWSGEGGMWSTSWKKDRLLASSDTTTFAFWLYDLTPSRGDW